MAGQDPRRLPGIVLTLLVAAGLVGSAPADPLWEAPDRRTLETRVTEAYRPTADLPLPETFPLEDPSRTEAFLFLQGERPAESEHGEAWEYISQGRAWVHYVDAAHLRVWDRGWPANGLRFDLTVPDDRDSNSYSWWDLTFTPPEGEPLEARRYEVAVRPITMELGQAGLDVSGHGRGRNRSLGWFEIRALERAPDGSLLRFEAHFEQRSPRGGPALRGALFYHRAATTESPAAGTPRRDAGWLGR